MMKTTNRADQILRELRQKGSLSLDELIADLGASAASVRRDLAKLEAKGLVRRTHGGVTLVEPLLYEPFRYDSLFQNREQHRTPEKRKIGLAAAELILENETVGFTAGTTTTHVARNLRNRLNIRVITNAINIAMELSNCPGLKTFVTGGFVQWAGSFSLVGHAAITSLSDIYMDRVFVSVCGIDPARGITVIEPEEGLTFRSMIEQAKQTIVVADSSKIGMVTPALICPISDIHLVITDTRATDKAIAPFLERGIEVRRV
ncbi:MAG TPA: DeoR/GlpR family DNA-binding transcription regulator [Candidatus Sulfotelmatobacter sp.]|jgi:DeoR family transcriptional regulator, aga operon transcriptional repressor|nr:DeoR/GlpR family DNA-binding transcription regulator [Candidatus Sulfotelmatobacter sp.]